LHQLLAVQGDVKNEYNHVLEERKTTLQKKADHFLEGRRELKMFDAARQEEESAHAQHKEMVSTVPAQLDYMRHAVERRVDHMLQTAATNQTASADWLADGIPLGGEDGQNLPVVFLLEMEQILSDMRQVVEKIPTLAPGVKWIPDPQKGKGVYQAEFDEDSLRTEKKLRWQEVAPSTDKHKAQVETWKEDVPVGKYSLKRWSGMITPAAKSRLLGAISKRMEELKRARMRANNAEIVQRKFAKALMDSILCELDKED
jgi:hypothetical protein